MMIFFLEIAVMLFMALLCGQGMRMLRFPAVLGELFGGIILGPTVWGWLSQALITGYFQNQGPFSMAGMPLSRSVCCSFYLQQAWR